MADTKIALCWIGIGSYNFLFEKFYSSFNSLFCKGQEVMFFVFTDQPEVTEGKSNCITYLVSHACTHTGYVLFRKFKYLLMAEDQFLNYDFVAFMNGNCVCNKPTTLDDMMPNRDFISCITHPYMSEKKINIISDPKTSAFCIAKRWTYKQAGVFMMRSKTFLKLANQLEAWRMTDKANGTDKLITSHDETYWNKLMNLNRQQLNILDGKKFACPEHLACSKDANIMTRTKTDAFQAQGIEFPKRLTQDIYQL